MARLAIALLFIALLTFIHESREAEPEGKKWAVLVAGSNGYENYRHQADVCHAYQILRKGGLKDENIIVFMYDDIAMNEYNPRPGIIINKPYGADVYDGVPKDYTGQEVNVENFFAVILGNKPALKGGSGKVVDSGPDDHIFIYYTDHGSAGVLGMPSGGYLFAKDLIDVLKKKHESRTYRRMVFYLEACESGSMFEGLLPNDMNIYATTASNAEESSYGTYCSQSYPPSPPEYDTCLGDTYSIAWMEDSDMHDMRTETLEEQYQVVRRRTAYENEKEIPGSHVMQYGNVEELSKEFLFTFMGTNHGSNKSQSGAIGYDPSPSPFPSPTPSPSIFKTTAYSQRDAELLHFQLKYERAPEGSVEKVEAQKRLLQQISHRTHVDNSMKLITEILFGRDSTTALLAAVRPPGQPLLDDWSCLKSLVRTYEDYCGPLLKYGMKYMRALANMCNLKVESHQMTMAAKQACKN